MFFFSVDVQKLPFRESIRVVMSDLYLSSSRDIPFWIKIPHREQPVK